MAPTAQVPIELNCNGRSISKNCSAEKVDAAFTLTAYATSPSSRSLPTPSSIAIQAAVILCRNKQMNRSRRVEVRTYLFAKPITTHPDHSTKLPLSFQLGM